MDVRTLDLTVKSSPDLIRSGGRRACRSVLITGTTSRYTDSGWEGPMDGTSQGSTCLHLSKVKSGSRTHGTSVLEGVWDPGVRGVGRPTTRRVDGPRQVQRGRQQGPLTPRTWTRVLVEGLADNSSSPRRKRHGGVTEGRRSRALSNTSRDPTWSGRDRKGNLPSCHTERIFDTFGSVKKGGS